jgi:hypothetical protein
VTLFGYPVVVNLESPGALGPKPPGYVLGPLGLAVYTVPDGVAQVLEELMNGGGPRVITPAPWPAAAPELFWQGNKVYFDHNPGDIFRADCEVWEFEDERQARWACEVIKAARELLGRVEGGG